MTIDDFIRNFEDAIEGLPGGTVSPATVFRDLEQWDSLAVLTTLAMVDAEYEVSLSANELSECRSVEDIFNRVKLKKGSS